MIETQDLAADALAVVLAGGKGTPLGALTKDICKPALPFGAAYRNIGFTLSNCLNSGIRRIGVATQHKPVSLLRHIEDVWSTTATGRPKMMRPAIGVGEGNDSPRSLVGAGCEVSGAVHRSVLFSGARVARGAIVESSILLPDGTVMSSASRRDSGGHAEPLVITAEDFVSQLVYSKA